MDVESFRAYLETYTRKRIPLESVPHPSNHQGDRGQKPNPPFRNGETPVPRGNHIPVSGDKQGLFPGDSLKLPAD